MICRLRGQLAAINDESAVVDSGPISYEILMPAHTLLALRGELGRDVSLSTLQYLEGHPAGAHLTPRLVGFLDDRDRALFGLLTRIRGISVRKALRAMSLPTPQIATAITRGEIRLLTSLPEIGRKTATQIVSELQEAVQPLSLQDAHPAPLAALTGAQRVAVDILVQWGDRRADAERWVAAAVDHEPALAEPDEIVRAAYRVKGQRS